MAKASVPRAAVAARTVTESMVARQERRGGGDIRGGEVVVVGVMEDLLGGAGRASQEGAVLIKGLRACCDCRRMLLVRVSSIGAGPGLCVWTRVRQ